MAFAKPFLTVMLPVRNEAACIERTIRRLTDQDYDPDCYEIIVADGRSTDDTVPIVRRLQAEFPQLKLLHNARRWSSAARNLCVRHGRGDFFVLIDGHCDIQNPRYLSCVVDAFSRSGADCLGRPQPLEISLATPVQEAIASARRSWLGHNPSSFIYSDEEQYVEASSVAIAYRRRVFQQVGLFDERFDACEDVEFNHRVDAAGLKCFFTPNIAVQYHPRGSLRGLFRQMTRYGRGRIRLAAKHPESLTLPAIAPMALFLGLAVCFLLGAIHPLFAGLFLLGSLAYSSGISLATAGLIRRPGTPISKACLPLVFVTIHAGFAWGTLSELITQFTRLPFGRLKPASTEW